MNARQKLVESPEWDTLNRHLSAVYLLFSLGINHLEQAEDTLRRFGLCVRDIKQSANRIDKEFDRFDRLFQSILSDEGRRTLFAKDYEETLAKFDTLLGFRNDGKDNGNG